MCQGDTTSSVFSFMGIEGSKCYCFNGISGAMLLSNRACNSQCPGDSAELCGGKGSLSIYQLVNDSFTDVMAVVGGWDGTQDKINLIMEDGTECTDHDIPKPNNEFGRVSYAVIEDHTIVGCGGIKPYWGGK